MTSPTRSASAPTEDLQQAHAAADALLEQIRDQIGAGTFAPDDALIAQMVEYLGDTRGMVRLGFAESIGELGRRATPFLRAAVSGHSNVVVRRAAGKTLTLIADPEAVPTLVQALLTDEDTVVKGSAVGALARTGEAAVPALLEILASATYPESAKGHAAWALSFIGAEAADYLYPAIESPVADVRFAVVSAIGGLAQKDDRAFALLVQSLQDPVETVRAEAIAALSLVNKPEALEPLLNCLSDGDDEIRKSVVRAVMKLQNKSAIPMLEAALDRETVPGIRSALEMAIGQLSGQ
jgi:bilin biosynthesis protein